MRANEGVPAPHDDERRQGTEERHHADPDRRPARGRPRRHSDGGGGHGSGDGRPFRLRADVHQWYFRRLLTWSLTDLSTSGCSLPSRIFSSVGCISRLICGACSVIGKRIVCLSFRYEVKALTSTPFFLCAATALCVASGMAGNTTAESPTMF